MHLSRHLFEIYISIPLNQSHYFLINPRKVMIYSSVSFLGTTVKPQPVLIGFLLKTVQVFRNFKLVRYNVEFPNIYYILGILSTIGPIIPILMFHEYLYSAILLIYINCIVLLFLTNHTVQTFRRKASS